MSLTQKLGKGGRFSKVSNRSARIKMARLVKAKEADRSFDLEFWRKLGAEERFAAAWQMIAEVEAIRGREIRESRLQRSVQSIQRVRR